jgi:alpha,alpha-trehalose-phosphate synthase [UDP-forming]/trehalose-phosphatase
MISNKLKAFLDGGFAEKPLVVVTNREPYIHKKTNSGIKYEAAAGGVATALDDVMKATGGVWVAWGSGSADKDVVDDNNSIWVPPDEPSYILKRVWLTPSQVENYYNGYSNRVLWPLCHIALERVYFKEKYWKAYREVNELFANSVIEISEDNPVVWIHDYHLCLVPAILRQRNPNLTIAHFWHIPWPDWSVFRICPQAEELIKGLLGCDLIGFQIPLFVKNFLDCVSECLPAADVDYFHSTVRFDGHLTNVKTFPISIDFEKFDSTASDKSIERKIKEIKREYNLENKYIGIGVDRLEYTKALIKRLQAIDLFFEKYRSMRERFTFIQISASTRMQEPYLSYKKAVEKMIGKINEKFSTDRWKPVIYLDKKLSYPELVAFYRMADVAIISSIYDGMNLVAKEYIASQIDRKGTLILSELAGAAEELEGAILINPYDIESFAKSIYKALKMSFQEKQKRMDMMREHVKEHDIYNWISEILKEIMILSSIKNKKCLYLYNNLDEVYTTLKDRDLFLFLDYDGTLTPIVDSPEKAMLSESMKRTVKAIADYIPVAVISGRALDDIRERVGIEGIIYAGNHGAEIWDGEKVIVSYEAETTRHILQDFLERLKKVLSPLRGVIIEDKGVTASIHYRQVSIKNLSKLFRLFNEVAEEFKDIFRITTGKKVFEIRPLSAWNKGDAVNWLLDRFGPERMPIYIGDDVTDEDAFHTIEGRGVSIGVGINCNADYYLRSQSEVERFLRELVTYLSNNC